MCCPTPVAIGIRGPGVGFAAMGLPLGMLADMLASGINAHLGGGQQAPTLVEEQVLTWLKEMMGMPAEFERPAHQRRHHGEFAGAGRGPARQGWF